MPNAGSGPPTNSGVPFLEIDPTSDAGVAAAAAQVQDEYGRLDVLINNAGTAEPRVGAADLTAEEAMMGFGINVFGPIRVTHAFPAAAARLL
jgi:NAD(P)-dependent dehydrogenase (short-subunit alcohol dehydrogenase family)